MDTFFLIDILLNLLSQVSVLCENLFISNYGMGRDARMHAHVRTHICDSNAKLKNM